MKGDVIVISSCLKPWERPGIVRYYCGSRVSISDYERAEYEGMYGVDPADRRLGVKIYFDDKGELHIDNCASDELRGTLEARVRSWYDHQCELFRSRFLKHIHIYDHVEHFTVRLPDGRFRTEYKGLTYTCEKCDMDYLKRFGEVVYDALTATYEIGPQEPELRAILSAMIDDLDPRRRGILPVPED